MNKFWWLQNCRRNREHNEIIRKFVKPAREFNVKFILDYKVNKGKYLGREYSAEKEKPDSEYMKAVLILEEPTNKKELLGMVNYLAELNALLKSLTKKNVDFKSWNEQKQAFLNIKRMINEYSTLSLFDPSDNLLFKQILIKID